MNNTMKNMETFRLLDSIQDFVPLKQRFITLIIFNYDNILPLKIVLVKTTEPCELTKSKPKKKKSSTKLGL